MPSEVVLVTGVGGELGSRLLARLGASPAFARVLGVDTTPPRPHVLRRLGRAEFVRADIRNPLIAKIISDARVGTVVHAATTCHPAGPARRGALKEVNVIGTMRLLAACQRSASVRKLVVKSTTAVYGADASSPAVFTEDSELIPASSTGYAKDAIEMEGYVRGLARRRPDLTITTLRFANIIGPDVDTVLARYFALPVVPSVLGYDARLQLLHASDALTVLELATLEDRPGGVQRRGGRGTHPRAGPAQGGQGRTAGAAAAAPLGGQGAAGRPRGRLLDRPGAAAELRPRRGHHAAEADLRVPPAVDDGRGVRRLRARPRAAPRRPRRAPGGAGRPGRGRSGDRSGEMIPDRTWSGQ
ncbi:hypothetical protein GCM10023214_58250 [Amycolatopsis dongchuanensis]|uniref:NAD-dependent epimerase/dehydratase domain-containing protein n=1 Tax=Amycolatopsis dongchuanensis TaxID=1070866 RepID=A0ABP8VD09_9PSEU